MTITYKIVHGMAISDTAMRVLIGDRFVSLWEDYKRYRDFKTFWFNSKLDPKTSIEKKIELSVFALPELSQFIIGTKLRDLTIDNNQFVEFPVFNATDINLLTVKIRKYLRKYGLEEEIKTVII